MNNDAEKFERFYSSEFGKQILEKEAEYIRRNLNSCEFVLDVGCGIGVFESKLSNFNFIGVDSAPEMIKKASKNRDTQFILCDAGMLPIRSNIFEAAISITALEFMENYPLVVSEINRVTTHKSKILVMGLNTNS
ncbi:MAG: class I SAM-dependent methyltransferase, partial [Candidatus Odinarchaeia archaeon]